MWNKIEGLHGQDTALQSLSFHYLPGGGKPPTTITRVTPLVESKRKIDDAGGIEQDHCFELY